MILVRPTYLSMDGSILIVFLTLHTCNFRAVYLLTLLRRVTIQNTFKMLYLIVIKVVTKMQFEISCLTNRPVRNINNASVVCRL